MLNKEHSLVAADLAEARA